MNVRGRGFESSAGFNYGGGVGFLLKASTTEQL